MIGRKGESLHPKGSSVKASLKIQNFLEGRGNTTTKTRAKISILPKPMPLLTNATAKVIIQIIALA